MGKVYYALGLTATWPIPNNTNINLNSTLGANRGLNLSGPGNIAGGTVTNLSTDFGGLVTPQEYPWYVYEGYLQINSGGVCADTGGVLLISYDGPTLSTGLYSEGATSTVYRISSARFLGDTQPDYTFSDPVSRTSGYCGL